ncbi:phosphonate C-P lyase system protein PhnG [Palleronia sp.]|uniref:phosphonate C-P lyase system protein PhnG n=1 Tax=Palleronia sp. TaxID=1940284 RepID=UPI0035C860A5
MFDQTHTGGAEDHATFLATCAASPPDEIKAEAEMILPALGAVDVLQSRTGLIMQPMRDTVTGTDFHLGEVLVAEAHVRLPEHGVEGYGMVVGRDLEQAMAMALLDAARAAGTARERLTAFVRTQSEAAAQRDDALLRRVEATKVEMETF